MLYDWLKENPQERGPMLNEWHKCFNHPKFEVGCQKNLKELVKMEVPLTDAVLWAQRSYVLHCMLSSDRTVYNDACSFYKAQYISSRLVELLYSYAQHNDIVLSIEASYNLLNMFYSRNADWMYNVRVNYQNLVDAMTVHRVALLSNGRIGSLSNGEQILWTALTGTKGQLNNAPLYVMTCTQRCIEKIMQSTNAEIPQMLTDILRSTTEIERHKFNSINEIERAHKQITIDAENAIMDQYKKHVFVYNPLLVEIVERHGYYMPASPASLVVRGQQHDNCVATYQQKHTKGGSPCSRLIFHKSATVEMVFDTFEGVIYRCSIAQNKTRQNRHVDLTVELRDLMIELIGKPVEIIDVCEREIK